MAVIELPEAINLAWQISKELKGKQIASGVRGSSPHKFAFTGKHSDEEFAAIVKDKTILSTGYNGSIRGMPHCDEVGHQLEGGHCIATVHAEANAIIQAAKNGVQIDGAELYTTASPCWPCFKLIANSGIRRIYYGEFYRDEKPLAVAEHLGIELIDLQTEIKRNGS